MTDGVQRGHKAAMVGLIALHLLACLIFAYGYFGASESRLTLFGISLGHDPDEDFNKTIVRWRLDGRKTVVVEDGDPAKYAYTHTSHRLKYLDLQANCSNFTTPPTYTKLVLIVIDALRADFVPSINRNYTGPVRMPFLEGLLRDGQALGLISNAATPTVTMPRIKSIVSGKLPNFMDFILNLNAYKMDGDNLIENGSNKGRRIVFYGDDTWLSLFPEHLFKRSNGTTSFFASDYVQVDSNVTDNALPELHLMHDWDWMTLHYLGVDHIGHAHGGAHSRLMPKKLLEMDSVIEEIFKAAAKQPDPYLLVVTGDHGMTDIGNHGGSTKEESHTALVMASTKISEAHVQAWRDKTILFEDLFIEQVDLAPTLSFLYDLPLPRKSQGKVSLQVIDHLGLSDQFRYCALFMNAIQIQKLDKRIAQEKKAVIDQAVSSHLHFLAGKFGQAMGLQSIYMDYLTSFQTLLVTRITRLSPFSSLTVGLILSFVSIYYLIKLERKINVAHSQLFPIEYRSAHVCLGLVVPLLHTVCFGSTSFIEGEHYFWHYITGSLIVLHVGIALKEYLRIQLIAKLRAEQTARQKKDDDSKQEDPAIEEIQETKTLRAEIFKNLIRNLFKGPATHFSLDAAQYLLCKMSALLFCLVVHRLTTAWVPIQVWLQSAENVHYLSAAVICSAAAISFLMSVRRFGKQQCLLISGLVWVYLYRSELGLLTSFRIPKYLFGMAGYHIGPNFRAHVVYFHVFCILIEAGLKKIHMDYNWSLVDLLSFSFLNQASIKEQIDRAATINERAASGSDPGGDQSYRSLNAQILNDVHQKIRHRYTVVASTHTLVLRTLVTGWVLLACLLARVGNIPLICLHILLEQVLNYALHLNWKDDRYRTLLPITYLTAATSAWYSAGNSNLFSTIDVGAGYVGLSEYSPFLVGCLMMVNTYALLVYWVLMLYVRLIENRLNYYAAAKSLRLWSIMNLQLLIRWIAIGYYMIVAILLRNHLFVWSVLSPKYLFELVLTAVTAGLVGIVGLCHLVD